MEISFGTLSGDGKGRSLPESLQQHQTLNLGCILYFSEYQQVFLIARMACWVAATESSVPKQTGTRLPIIPHNTSETKYSYPPRQAVCSDHVNHVHPLQHKQMRLLSVIPPLHWMLLSCDLQLNRDRWTDMAHLWLYGCIPLTVLSRASLPRNRNLLRRRGWVLIGCR